MSDKPKNKEFTSSAGKTKAQVLINKYGVELNTTRNGGIWTGITMTPELATATIAALNAYLEWI